MNVHLPQDEISRAEGYNILNANNQYVKPTSGEPIRALIQVFPTDILAKFCFYLYSVFFLFMFVEDSYPPSFLIDFIVNEGKFYYIQKDKVA